MKAKVLYTAWVLTLLAVAPLPLHAADPAFCRPYARAAIVAVRAALASPRCGAGLRGARWSTAFSVHFEWCLGASRDAAAVERSARRRLLKKCGDE